ncbi:hypothetical protein EZS27_006639 [termite gut metagenome]|uniref:Uncharacterized protein n=1 Tax=termite gut metagenome TaxID=433724 RepID=A0A5J4SIX2_9ZZZZ
MQPDVNSDRYKIDCTMKPLTVKSTGQMSEYTKSWTGIVTCPKKTLQI